MSNHDQPYIQLSGAVGGMTNYVTALEQLGARCNAQYAPAPDLGCDGLLLCGGGDIEPARFGQELSGSQPPDQRRDQRELALFHAFLQAGKPIFGICRGMQVINVALGGTLIQDLPEEIRPFHTGTEGDRVHPIRAAEGSLLHGLYGPICSVNSSHHQAIDRLGAGLEAIAWSESGVVEGLFHQARPIFGVQFHPERMSFDHRRRDTVNGAPLLMHFLKLCCP